MLFNFSKKSPKLDIHSKLKEIKSDGLNLSIDELIPYQSKTSLIDLAARKQLHGKMSGNYLSRSKGRGMEFDEVRHYQTGDDIRAIDWRVTARTGKTHTKLFREEIERPVLIATDLSQSMFFGSQFVFKSIQAAHLASLVAWHAKGRGDRIGGIVFNESSHSELKPRSRKEGVLHYLHALTSVHAETYLNAFSSFASGSTNSNAEKDSSITNKSVSSTADIVNAFEKNCARIRQLAKPGSLVYLITDGQCITQEAVRHLSQITRHCELVVCLISDLLEKELPKAKARTKVAITDGNERQSLILGDKKVAEAYRQQAKLRGNFLKETLEKSGARIENFHSGDSLENQLRQRHIK